ncbi:MAG: hypothetical protein AAF539_06215 [Planctomycetota bacterium]
MIQFFSPSILAQAVDPNGLPQVSPTTVILIVAAVGVIAYLYFSGKDVGSRRHQPGRRRRGAPSADKGSDCLCPPSSDPTCVPAYTTQRSRKPYVVYLNEDGCCGGDRITAEDLQAIVDHDGELIAGERRQKLQARMQTLFAGPAESASSTATAKARKS